MSDAWDTAFSEATAELEGEAGTEESAPAPVEVEESSVEDTPNETVEEPVTAAVAPEAVAVDSPWWQGHEDDTVKIGDVDVPFTELQKGYLRQADYTRKTQEVADVRRAAEWAARVQTALKQDPVNALKQMAVELGLLDSNEEDFRPDEIDPALEQLHLVKQEVSELRNESLLLKVQREIEANRARYSDFDEGEVLALAAEYGERGIGLTIEQAYFLWKGQTATEREAAAARAKVRADEEAQRLAAARAQSEKVASGHNPLATEGDAELDSFEDIFEAAWEKLGGS